MDQKSLFLFIIFVEVINIVNNRELAVSITFIAVNYYILVSTNIDFAIVNNYFSFEEVGSIKHHNHKVYSVH